MWGEDIGLDENRFSPSGFMWGYFYTRAISDIEFCL